MGKPACACKPASVSVILRAKASWDQGFPDSTSDRSLKSVHRLRMRGMTLATVSVPRTLRLITALCKLSDLMHTLNVSSSAPAAPAF